MNSTLQCKQLGKLSKDFQAANQINNKFKQISLPT